MLDPLITTAIAIGIGVLFLVAGLHKLRSLQVFRATLSDYQLLPEALLTVTARIVPAIEILLGASWLRIFYNQNLTALSSVMLLCIYAAAIGINLRRGRVHIDCGCSFGGQSSRAHPIAGGLIVRNLVLAALAAMTLLPVSTRPLVLGDYIVIAAVLITATLLFAASNQLISNRASINTWRKGARDWRDE